MTIGIGTGWRCSKGEATSAEAEATCTERSRTTPTTSLSTSPPTNFFRQFNLRFPTIVKGGFYHKLAAYVYFGRPDLGILPWEETDRVPALQAAKI
jgi:S-adenosylmethionine synthetase